ncbi:VOC family protein [Candidatus Kaiserbacteria bacterium]|nr:VOC family protein [Candidatus Kaiserbacteria bacterium]
MKPKISLVTLGVKDLEASTKFYKKLGFKEDENNDGIVFFKLQNLTLALFPREALANDAGVSEEGSGFRAFSLAHNVASAHEVDTSLNVAKKAGAKIIKTGHKASWGGYTGYFADPDGFLWEVAWNPFMEL